MEITSKAFSNGGTIPALYTCDGQDKIPQLSFEGVPAEAKSLVLIVDDPDAPVGTWDHWILFNISPTVTGIREGEEPAWPHGMNTRKRTVWNGPCPPDREHRYFFKLYALDTSLSLKEGATKKEVENVMEGHIIAQAELVGKYKRPWM